MEKISEQVTAEYKPFILLTAFKSTGSGDFYIETNPIDEKGRVLAGKPMDHNTMDAILKQFDKTKSEKVLPTGTVPAGLIYIDNIRDRYVWVAEPSKRFLHFAGQIKIDSGDAYMPRLVFSASGNSLKVFAIKKLGDEKAKLHLAPFHNTSGNGHVCMGSAKATLKGNSFKSIIEFWETKFFGSEFTHLSGESPIKGNLNTMWKDLIASGEKFDQSLLIETKQTIGDLLK